jgi:glutamate formiminotransferase
MEAVPNLSEARRGEVADQVAAEFAGAHRDAALLHTDADADHNRTVLTLAGTAEGLLEAAVAGAAAAARLIDLGRHRGAHPRMGVLDVLPFVPLDGVVAERVGVTGASMAECVALAHAAGERLAAAGLPVYFYGAAALRPERAALPVVRRSGTAVLEGSRDPAHQPDLAPSPGTEATGAGAVAVGARELLVAFNVDLDSDDLPLARRIAAAVRERDGGLPAVRALGLWLPRRGRVQVSMNLLDYRVTPPAAAFAAVQELATRAGVPVAASEVVGLLPTAALDGVDPASLRLAGWSEDRFLETHLRRARWRAG